MLPGRNPSTEPYIPPTDDGVGWVAASDGCGATLSLAHSADRCGQSFDTPVKQSVNLLNWTL